MNRQQLAAAITAALCAALSVGRPARADEASAATFPATAGYPTALIDRPLTLPQGTVQATLTYGAGPSSAEGTPLLISSTRSAFVGAVELGFSDRVQLGASTIVSTDSGYAGVFIPRLSVKVFSGEALQLAPSLTVPLLSAPLQGPLLQLVTFGLDARARLGSHGWIAFGQGAINFETAGHLELTALAPLTLGYQLTDNLAVYASTLLLMLTTRGSDNARLIGRDFAPLSAGALLAATSWLDLFGSISSPDLRHPAGWTATGGVQLRL